MSAIARQFFLVLLSVSITFAGVPLLPHTPVYAQQDTEQNEPEISIDEELKALRESIYGTRHKNANLDPFLLTAQHVLDTRQENIKGAIQEEIERDHQEKIDYFNDEIIAYKKMLKEADSRLAGLEEDAVSKRAGLEEVRADIQSRLELSEMELADARELDPKEGNGLDVAHMVDTSLRPQHYWGNKMTVSVKNSDNEKVLEVKQKSFTESLSPHFNKENPFSALEEGGEYNFSLVSPRGVLLNEFHMAVETVMFLGSYLVFVEKDEMDSVRSGVKKTLPIRFIDLNFVRANLGNAPLPVYTLPLKVTKAPEFFAIEGGRLKVGSQALSYPQFGVLANIHKVIFNMGAAMVDPATYKKTQPLIKSTIETFGKFMKAQDKNFRDQMNRAVRADSYLQGVMGSLDSKVPLASDVDTKDVLERALADGKITQEELAELGKGLSINEAFKDTNAASHQGRKFFNRMRLLIGNLVSPRPEGAAKLRNAILVAANFNKEDRLRVFKDSKKSIKLAMYGAGATGAVLGSTFLPPEHALHLSQTLDLLSATYQHFQGYLEHHDYGRNFYVLSKDAFMTSTSGVFGGIFKASFIEPYFSDGKWAPFLLGLAGVLAVTLKFFVPEHISINTYKIFKGVADEKDHIQSEIEEKKKETSDYFLAEAARVKDVDPAAAEKYEMYAEAASGAERESSQLGLFSRFTGWAARSKREYWDMKADAEKEVSGSDVSILTDREVELLEDKIRRLDNGIDSRASVEKALKKGRYKVGLLKGVRNSIAGFRNKTASADAIDDSAEELIEKGVVKDKESFMTAIAHSFFSFSSLKNTFGTNGLFWNFFFLGRSNYFRPTMWLMYFIYPNFTVVAKGELNGKQHFPTKYNSGLDLWPQKLSRFLGQLKQTRVGKKIPLPKLVFLSEESLSNLETFEDAVGKLELLAMEVASNKAQKALLENINDPERILALFDSTPTSDVEAEQRVARTGISTLHDGKLDKLNKKERAYYRAYYTKTFDVVMQKFVSDLLLKGAETDLNPEEFAKDFANQVKKNQVTNFKFTEGEVEAVEASLDDQIDYVKIKEDSEKIAKGWATYHNRVGLNFRHKVLRRIHPGNPQVNRQQIAGKMLRDSRAMDRAVRMEVNSMAVDIPISIGMTLLLYSAVPSGVLMPFAGEAITNDTHLHGMSRWLFYSDFIPGMILGLLANTWMKVQMDYRMASKGGFDRAILHKDSKKGFWRFFLKNLAKNPENKWKDNQIFYLKLVKANLAAAILTTLVFNGVGLHRFDVGSFIIGYTMIVASFLSGVGLKISNAFESSASWVAGQMPRKLRAHPKAQSYIDRKLQKKKMAFSVYSQLWTVAVVENIAGQMLILKENVKIGSRAFIRLIGGGETFTQMTVKMADALNAAFESVPGVSKILDWFKFGVSNKYEAFERYPEHLLERGNEVGVDRVYENPDLPKNLLAEVVGKIGGATVTIGSFASLPYIGTSLLERYSQMRVQARGRAFKREMRIRELEGQVAEPVAGSCRSFL